MNDSPLRLVVFAALFIAVSGALSWKLLGPEVPSPSLQVADPSRPLPTSCQTRPFSAPVGDLERHGFPDPGFHAPGSSRAPSASVIAHSLQHAWTVIKYPSRLTSSQRRTIETWTVSERDRRLLVLAGGDMPWELLAAGPSWQVGCREFTSDALRYLSAIRAGR